MAQKIDIFVSNVNPTQTIQICARTNTNCSSWTFNNNPCQFANNLTTIGPRQNGLISLAVNVNDNICLAVWTTPTIINNPPPNSTIDLPVTANSSGFELQWSTGLIQLIKTLCMTSVPGNTIPQIVDFYYQNNTRSQILVCVNTTFSCNNLNRGTNCGVNAITVNPGQLFRTQIGSLTNNAVCIASWANSNGLPSSAPPTNVTTIGPNSSISSILIDVSPTNTFCSTTYFTCDPSVSPLTILNINNCYDVFMIIQRLMDGNYVTVQTASPLNPNSSVTVQLPQGTMIRLIDISGTRVSGIFTVPAGPGPATVFFRSDGTNNPNSCGISPPPPVNSRVTVNNCNTIKNGLLEVFNGSTGQWISFIDPSTGQSVIISLSSNRTVFIPAGTNIRINYGSGDITQPFTVPNQATVNVYFLPDGTPSTSQICPVLTPPAGGALFSNSNNGTTAGLIRTNGTTAGIIRTNGTTFVGRTNGTTAFTSNNNVNNVELPTSNVTITNCFDTNLNVQTSTDNGSTWITLPNTSVNAKSSKSVAIIQGLMIRLSNGTTTSGSFTVPNADTSKVFFQANGGVSTTTCDEENRAGFFITIIVVVIIIIIILILLFALAPKAKPKAETSTSSVTHITQG